MTIQQTERLFMMENNGMKVSLDKRSLILRVDTGDVTWETVPEAASMALGFEDTGRVQIPLSQAENKSFSPIVSGYFQGIRIQLNHSSEDGIASGIQTVITVLMNTHHCELVFEVLEVSEGKDVCEVVWPGSFHYASTRESDYTVVPAMQGYLIPGNWLQPIRRYHQGMMFSRDAYMPWWGQVKDGNGYLSIIDTPADARLSIEHIPLVHTLAQVVWIHSLERFNATRRLRIRFAKEMNYVVMAKMYRQYVRSLGKLRTLTEKQVQKPQLSALIGSAVVHTSVHTRIAPESYYFDKENPELNDYAVSFEERALQLIALKEKYAGKLYVHVDGWGLNGYDNLHPDVLPPTPKGGGWEGFRKLQEVCRAEQILLALHDNYRDFYHDAASYDPNLTIKDRKGTQEFSDYWAGGAHSWLCTSLSKGYVERNHDLMHENGIHPDGVYIDVFAVVPGDECYDSGHRMTRTECFAYRTSCFEEIRSRGMLVSSEEPTDWALPALDLVHHAPYALDPDPGGGNSIGVSTPLFSLVYHDAIIVPWSLNRGDWGIPKTDLGSLHGLLNAGVPYLSIQPSDKEIPIVRTLARLHQLVGALEMTSHEFIEGGNWRKQRSTYSDGTIVEIDLDKDSFTIVAANEEAFSSEGLHLAD
ncbi:DUF5696 domain-containing protein [Paenibacillus sp. FSL R10-2734]|uniref:DUF5696 domain-containing protein n=1 Tax=Paenibacillus sp. FSL R10-2734 TaxID=2954691 RepID=UPI0030DBC586